MELEVIQNNILEIRGNRVMLDIHLTDLYEVEVKRLNEQVKRNLDRFPEDFMFQLNEIEFQNLRSQFATTNFEMRRTLPYVFTEQGVAMLSGILRSKKSSSSKYRNYACFCSIEKNGITVFRNF